MADVDHPKTHVENQEGVDLPRKQPESPKHEGIDPLTESDTMYPASKTRTDSEKLSKKQNDTLAEPDSSVQTVADQEALAAKESDETNGSDTVSESADNTAKDTSPSNKSATK